MAETVEDCSGPDQARRDRVLGCFLGGAVGDALGAEVEFLSTAAIRSRFGAAGLTGYAGAQGSITDDTQMSLFTAEGLLDAGADLRSGYLALLAPHLHAAYCRWLLTQVRDGPVPPPVAQPSLASGALVDRPELYAVRAPGTTCLAALRSGRRGSLATAINDSKGCGGVMRVAPIGLVAGIDPFTVAAEAASITHGHPSGYLSAGALAVVVAEVFAGAALPDAVSSAVDRLGRFRGHDETLRAVRAAVDLAEREPRPTPELVEQLGGGWVGEEALAIALYAALTAEDLVAGMLVAVNHSGDSDSTGAIAGNILGALLGAGAIPGPLLDQLAERTAVQEVAQDFADHVLG